MELRRIVDYIEYYAGKRPQALAVVANGDCLAQRSLSLRDPYGQMAAKVPGNPCALTYAQLWEEICLKAEEYSREGYGKGQVIPIRTTQDASFIISYYGAHLAGAVALPLEGDMPEDRFAAICQLYKDFIAPADVADILFTTGTTGRSKGVMVSHKAIIADAENLIGAMGFDPSACFVINGPLNHIGSLSKTYPVFMQGGSLYILEGMKDMQAFFNAMSWGSGKTATFLVPSAIRMLMQFARPQMEALASKIDFIETGAAPISQSDMEMLYQTLPQTRLYNTYASTETGIICTHEYSSDGCIPGCLGRPMKNSSVEITSSGKVACSGATIMTGYAAEPELTVSVLREGKVYTSDNAYIDDLGRLRLLGRDDDVINIGGFKVAPTEVEDVALSHPSVKDCLCICEQTPLGPALKLLVVLSFRPEDEGRSGEISFKDLARYLATRLERYKVPTRYQSVPEIRRTFNGKPDRKSYR